MSVYLYIHLIIFQRLKQINMIFYERTANEKKSRQLTWHNPLIQERSWHENDIYYEALYHHHMFVISF